MKTAVKFLGKEFANPMIVSSGVLGTTASTLLKCVRGGAGGVTTKSISLEPREGHANPTVIAEKRFLINAVGLSNAGVKANVEEIRLYKQRCAAPVIASIFAGSAVEFGQTAQAVSAAQPDFIEANISCPNVESEFGRPFAKDPALAAQVTKTVKKNTSIPLIVKLSPNVDDITVIARAVEEVGADAVCAVNTFSGTLIDVPTRSFVLHNRCGGVSGPAIRPMALKMVYDIHKAVRIPIIGVGGVTTGEDVLAMMLAGATLVGLGSAVHFRGPRAFAKIMKEIEDIMGKENIKELNSLIGGIHD